MQADILPYMRCTRCGGRPLRQSGEAVSCAACGADFALRSGILDMMGDDCGERITPFQRIMQTRLVVAVYEGIWRRAGYFIASSRSFDRELGTVLAMNSGKEPSRVLDLACGTGIFTRPLARQSRGIVVAVDLSLPMLRHARRLLRRDGLENVALIRASAAALPFTDGAFSYVNCCGALHLFDKPDEALAEIRRVLADEGHLCVQTTIRPLRSAGVAPFLENVIRFGFFDKQDLDRKITSLGFNILDSERHRISYTFLCRRIL